jgi:hypothetical protein
LKLASAYQRLGGPESIGVPEKLRYPIPQNSSGFYLSAEYTDPDAWAVVFSTMWISQCTQKTIFLATP